MPWNSSDVSRHNKGVKGKNRQKWAKIANAVLAKDGDEGKAIRIANAAVERRLRRGK